MPKSKQSTLGILDQLSYGLTIFLVLAFIVLHVRQKQWNTVGVFVGLMLILGVACESGACTHFKDLRVCALIALLASYVITLPMMNETVSSEQFANPDGPVEKLTVDVKPHDDPDDKTKKDEKVQDHHSADTDSQSDENDDDDDDDDDKENYVDTFSTFMETYKKLTPGQIEQMTTDTKELIETQRSLMATVKGLAPIIKEGKDMMKTFGDYFGPNAANDLLAAFKKQPSGGKHAKA